MVMTSVFEIIGMSGSLILCFSAIPQIIKTYRTKRIGDLSISYLGILMIGIILVMIYCVYIRNLIFIVSNGLSLCMTGNAYGHVDEIQEGIGTWRIYYPLPCRAIRIFHLTDKRVSGNLYL